MKIKEPEVMREIRTVRDRMAQSVEQKGILAFYSSLEGHAEELMERHRSPRRGALPRSMEARKAKRRALVEALPQPSAIQQVHRLREQLQDEKRRGEKLPDLNPQDKAFARRHVFKYVDSGSFADVLHDKPNEK